MKHHSFPRRHKDPLFITNLAHPQSSLKNSENFEILWRGLARRDQPIYLYLPGTQPAFKRGNFAFALWISTAPPVGDIFLDKSDLKLSSAWSRYLLAIFLILVFAKSDLRVLDSPCRPNIAAASSPFFKRASPTEWLLWISTALSDRLSSFPDF